MYFHVIHYILHDILLFFTPSMIACFSPYHFFPQHNATFHCQSGSEKKNRNKVGKSMGVACFGEVKIKISAAM
jgi:hypothetical protein